MQHYMWEQGTAARCRQDVAVQILIMSSDHNSSSLSGYKMELSFNCFNCSKPRYKTSKCQVRDKLTIQV